MAKTTRSATPSAGTIFEYRVARLRFMQGYFVRRSIDVWPNGLEGDKLAELDCWTVSFDPQLRRSAEVIECKTGGRGEGEVDRLIWLKGIEGLTKARSVTFAKTQVAPRTREFARRLAVDVLDSAAISTAEQELGIAPGTWIGFHDPEFGEQTVKPARTALSSSYELRRAGKYLFGSFWFTDDFSRIKQLRTFFRLLVEHEPILDDNALLLGIGEATTLFTLTIVSIASWRNQLTDAEFHQLVAEELSTGLGDPRNLRRLLRRVEDLQRDQIESIHSAYQRAGVGRIPFPSLSLETEILTPPEWVDAFIDLVTRFYKSARYATDIIRWTDLWAAGILGASLPQHMLTTTFDGRIDRLQEGLSLVQAFLTRVWGVPAVFFRADVMPTVEAQRDRAAQDSAGGNATGVANDTTPNPNAV